MCQSNNRQYANHRGSGGIKEMAKLPKYICLQVVPKGLDVELELVEPERLPKTWER